VNTSEVMLSPATIGKDSEDTEVMCDLVTLGLTPASRNVCKPFTITDDHNSLISYK